NALHPLRTRQVAARQRDDYGVIAPEQYIDENNLENGAPMEHLQKFEHICTVSKYLTRRPGTPPAAGDCTGILSTHRYLPAMSAMLSGVHHERKVAERRTPLNRLNGTVTGRGLRLFLLMLAPVARIQPILLQQSMVYALLHHPAGLEHQHFLDVLNGRQAMGNVQGRAVLADLIQGTDYRMFRPRI